MTYIRDEKIMKKFFTLALIAFTSLGFANDQSQYLQSSQSSGGMNNYTSVMDYLQKNQYDDGTNFIISVVPAAVQPTFTMVYFTDITLANIGQAGVVSGDINFHREKLPADYRFGVTGQFSYLLPTDSYLDLFYNYYGISASASNHIKPGSVEIFDDFVYGGKGGLSGQYHFAEFYFRTRIALLNLLGKYFHNDASFGFSFQNLNLHHNNAVNDIHFQYGDLNTDDGQTIADLSFRTTQKHKVFAFGPSFKWLTTLDLIPMRMRPHNLSFVSEVKFALLYSKYYGKGTASLAGQIVTTGSTAGNDDTTTFQDFNARWRSPSNYFVTLNTNLKAGLLYTYKDFSIEGAYKILYFSDEDYNVADFLKGTFAQGIIPDVSALFNVFPTNIGFRAFEVAVNYKF